MSSVWYHVFVDRPTPVTNRLVPREWLSFETREQATGYLLKQGCPFPVALAMAETAFSWTVTPRHEWVDKQGNRYSVDGF